MLFVQWCGIFLGGILLQRLFVNELLTLHGVLPDVLLVILALFGLRHGRLAATLAGFGAGLLLDALSSGTFGLTALCKSIAGFLAGSFVERPEVHYTYFFPVLLFSVAFIHQVLYNMVETFHEEVSFVTLTMHATLPAAGYTTLVGALVHYGIRK